MHRTAMAPISSNYYEILGVARNATAEEIHRAYRKLARRYHPDVNASVDARGRFAELSSAYEVLHDPEQRAQYDRRTGDAVRISARPARPAPAFTAGRPRREAPRFLDDETKRQPLGEPVRGPWSAVVIWDLPLNTGPRFGPARRRRPGIRWLR